MFRVVVAAVFCVAFLGMTGVGAQNAPQPDIRQNISYGPDPAQQLDLCLPPADSSPAPRPAVVMIHGGYWTVGDKSAYAYMCKVAADEGIVAAAIGYRLANGSEHNRWPAQLVDAQLAVRWLRSHAREFGVDPAKICALGDSSGAHLAVFLAALDHTMPGDYANEIPGVSSKVACAVDNFGPVDLAIDSYWPPGPQLFGIKQGERDKDKETAASPLFLVGPGTAPIMIAHGRDDKAVNIEQSQRLYDQLKRNRVPVKMIQYNGGHEFAGLAPQELQKIFQAELDFIKQPSGAR